MLAPDGQYLSFWRHPRAQSTRVHEKYFEEGSVPIEQNGPESHNLHKAKILKFRLAMEERFICGLEANDFDYSFVDSDLTLDQFNREKEMDDEERYFDAD